MAVHIGLDLGTSLGWAVSLANGVVVEVGVVKFKKANSPGEYHRHVLQTLRDLIASIEACWGKATSVVVEDVTFAKFRLAYKAYVEKRTLLELMCADLNLNLRTIHTATLKKYATSSGRATKKQMVEAALVNFKHVNWWPKGKALEDAADAAWVASYGGSK